MENKKQTFCIESLKEKHKVSEAVFEGTKAAEGWRKVARYLYSFPDILLN